MTFSITISDNFFGTFKGTFEAASEAEAIESAKDFYAEALDTFLEDIEIEKVELLNQ